MRPGILLYTSNRLEELLEALATVQARDPLPPLATETIVVPAQGLARWLQLRLAERHGIAAGLQLRFPGAFLAGLGADHDGMDLFASQTLVLRLWRLFDDVDLRAELGPAASYLEGDHDGQRRLQLCQRLAACFDDYQLYRDDLLARMAGGDELAELGPHGPWQARLWRALLADAGQAVPAARSRSRRRRGDVTPPLFPDLEPAAPPAVPGAHRLARLRALLDDPTAARSALPPRLFVFGAGTLPPQFLDLLVRIAHHVPVHLFVPQPTLGFAGGPRGTAGHPLLQRFAQEAREFADQLAELEGRAPVPFDRLDVAAMAGREPPAGRQPTLLERLQRDLAEQRQPGTGRHLLRADDDSLRVHDCHSEQRELEVVRDQILAAFAADPSLEPHDVLVLVPDIARYAPFTQAVFGPFAAHLPFHVADKAPAADLPLCASFFAVLDLAQDRLPVHEVLRVLEEPAVQQRFGVVASDLPALRERCAEAGIRWGLDGEFRSRHAGLPAFAANSWRQGLDRLWLGVATGPAEDLVLGMLPCADATSSREGLLARFTTFLETLFGQLDGLRRPLPPATWAERLQNLLGALFAPEGAEQELALARLQQALATLVATAAAARLESPLSLPVVSQWLREALPTANGNRGFLAGAVTVAALLPMRTVPIRQLFLCGLDDQTFPRRDQPAPFDLLAARRRPGDRSARLDDRQLFLDTLLAARERLHLTFVGHSQKDDSALSPSIVLTELLDVVDATCSLPDGGHARDQVLVRHPLQPWSPRYHLGHDPRLFTYALTDTRLPVAPHEEAPFAPPDLRLPPLPPGEVTLDELGAFWRSPSRAFLARLGVRQRRDDDPADRSEAFTLGNLERYQIAEELLQRTRLGHPPRDPQALAQATGLLPVGGLGAAHFVAIDDDLHGMLAQLTQFPGPRTVDLRLPCGDDVLVARVADVTERAVLLCRAARLKSKDVLRGFVVHATVAVARHRGTPGLPSRTVILGRDGLCELQPLDAATAEHCLAQLLNGRRLGLESPLPFFEHASPAYAKAVASGKDHHAAWRAASAQYQLPDNPKEFPTNDLQDHDIRLCHRGRDPLAEPAFATWAMAIWGASMLVGGKPR